MYRLSDVKPSRRALLLSRLYGTQPKAMELYLQEGKVLGVIPVEKLSMKFGQLFEKYASSREGAQRVMVSTHTSF
jgi:hypothetical protein